MRLSEFKVIRWVLQDAILKRSWGIEDSDDLGPSLCHLLAGLVAAITELDARTCRKE